MIKSDTIGKLVVALTTAQAAFGSILKEKENPGFKKEIGGVKHNSKYADLDAAIKATQPALIANGLVVTQFPVNTDTRVGVLSILAHISGEFIGQEYTLPIFKQDAQTGVAGITYSRRAAYLGILSASAEDDDGNAAAGRKVDESADTFSDFANKSTPPQAVFSKTELSKIDEVAVTLGYAKAQDTGSLPDEAQLQAYTDRLRKLREKLQTEGKLKPSAGLSAPRKVLNYVLKATGMDDLKKISIVQWDAFMSYAEKMDPVELVRLINQGGK